MTQHALFPYLDTCGACEGFGCEACAGSGSADGLTLHPRTSRPKTVTERPVQLSTGRKVWPHMDASTPYDPMSVHRHGQDGDGG